MESRLSTVLRPIEWAVLGFIGFVLLRVGPGVFLEFQQLAGLRTVTVFSAAPPSGSLMTKWTSYSVSG